MKYLLVLFIALTTICFTSCDGKERALKTPTEKIKDSTLSKSFFENTEYFPKDYTESITDTLFNNGYAVRVKFFSNMNDNLINDFKVDTIHYKHYYRRFKARITISKDNTTPLNIEIDKNFIIKHDISNTAFIEAAIMRLVWLDDEVSSNTNTIVNILFCKPETDDCLFYKLLINNKGDYTLKLTNEVYYNES